jgi:hypothetical protein
MVEVAFALVYGWFAVNRATESSGYVESMTIVAAVYLVVRGLDNVYEGLIQTG